MNRTGVRSAAAMPKAAVRTLTGADEVHWVSASGSRNGEVATPSLASVAFEDALPARRGPAYRQQRNQHGLYYWQSLDRHIWHESGLELASLLALDFEGQVAAISAQPMLILFCLGSTSLQHTPDYFARHRNGDQVVYDVKPAQRIDAAVRAQFDETQRVCDLIGWRYEVVTDLDQVYLANLRWLRGWRHPRNAPSAAALTRLIEIFEDARPLGDGSKMYNFRHPQVARPLIYHLLWSRVLAFDAGRRLGSDSEVWLGKQSESCAL